MNAITFFVPGKCVTQGSFNPGRRFYNSKELVNWRKGIIAAALAAKMPQDWSTSKPMIVTAIFVFERPRSHFKAGKNAHLLRDDAPICHSYKPDVDKLIRALLDAITCSITVWNDDCQVVRVEAEKWWASYATSKPGVAVTIRQA